MSQNEQYTQIIQPQRVVIKGFQSLMPEITHLRDGSSMSSCSDFRKFMMTDTKHKWKKKIQTDFSGMAPRLQKILRNRYNKDTRVDEKTEIEILKLKTTSIQAKHEINKVKIMKNTQNICFEQKKWIEQRIRRQIQQQSKWINEAVQRAMEYKVQDV